MYFAQLFIPISAGALGSRLTVGMWEIATGWNALTRRNDTSPRDFPNKLLGTSTIWACANRVGNPTSHWGAQAKYYL